jgi:hypothetical protein
MSHRVLRLKPQEPRTWSKPKAKPEPKPKRPALQAIPGGRKSPHTRCYYIEWEPAGEHWTILTDDGLVLGHAHDRDVAAGLAIRAASHDHGEGAEVMVCVQQENGASALAWPPPRR